MLYALLTDSTGCVLLVRRRGSALWSLPGGELRPGTPAEDLLTAYSQRQTGIVPDGFGPLEVFAFAGSTHAVATGNALRARAGARGRIEAIHWGRPEALPTETDPAARVAVATMLRRLISAKSANAVATVSAFQPAEVNACAAIARIDPPDHGAALKIARDSLVAGDLAYACHL